MNIRTRKYEPTRIRMTDLQFETWPATGLTPNRYCFLYALFGQCREKAKDADVPNQIPEIPEKWVTRMN